MILRCLLVDDDRDDQKIFLLALRNVHKSIVCSFANNSGEAINLLNSTENRAFDFIFLDLNMPRVNGRQCPADINKIPRHQQTPVIIYSTSSGPWDKIETKQSGACGFITKTPDIDHLAKILLQVFKQSQ